MFNITPERWKFVTELKSDYSKRIKKYLKKDIQSNKFILVCDLDGELIGSIAGRTMLMKNNLYKDKCLIGFLEYLMVTKKYRNQGIASKLKDELFKYFRKKKVDAIRLEVVKTNPAIKSYEKWGFESDTIKMIKKLK